MIETFTDLKKRLLAAGAQSNALQLSLLNDEVESLEGALVDGQLEELRELMVEAFGRANAAKIGEQKPNVICKRLE